MLKASKRIKKRYIAIKKTEDINPEKISNMLLMYFGIRRFGDLMIKYYKNEDNDYIVFSINRKYLYEALGYLLINYNLNIIISGTLKTLRSKIKKSNKDNHNVIKH